MMPKLRLGRWKKLAKNNMNEKPLKINPNTFCKLSTSFSFLEIDFNIIAPSSGEIGKRLNAPRVNDALKSVLV